MQDKTAELGDRPGSAWVGKVMDVAVDLVMRSERAREGQLPTCKVPVEETVLVVAQKQWAKVSRHAGTELRFPKVADVHPYRLAVAVHLTVPNRVGTTIRQAWSSENLASVARYAKPDWVNVEFPA